MMRTVLGFILGLVFGYIAVLFGWIGFAEIAGVRDTDGGKIMGIAFFFAPIAAVVAGIVGAVVLRRLGRA